jgi:hypothetical protein
MDLRQVRSFIDSWRGRAALAPEEQRSDPRGTRGLFRRLSYFGALLGFAALGCGGERYIVLGSARAPSTAGFVEASGSGGSSTDVTVHMEQLHPVDSLDPSLHAYVVWFEHGKSPPVRAGSLRYKPDDRVGELEAKAPFRKFVVKITAEANDKPSAPSEFIVATQEIFID